LDRKDIKNIKDIYDASSTYRQFIKVLHASSNDCMIFDNWLDHFMDDIGVEKLNLHKIDFIIHASTVESWNVDVDYEVVDETHIKN
jgi:hypothetical protein